MKHLTLRVIVASSLMAAVAMTILFAADSGGPASAQVSGGPVLLMGIDAEDGGPGGHGPITVYEGVVNSIKAAVTNGGSGILVIGGNKSPSDDVTVFWNQIGTDTATAVSFVNGDTNIAAQSFAGIAMIAVASSSPETFSGGLTQAENDALAARVGDIAAFVNGGGGLLGFSQTDFSNPYAYIGGLGAFAVNLGLGYEDISPTAEGTAIGITDALDICCWHDEYTTFPSFLSVLATNVETGQPAAIGGAQVIILPEGPFGNPTCSDQIDNDADELIDAADPDCAPPATPTPSPPPSPTPVALPVALPPTGGSPADGASVPLWIALALGAFVLASAAGLALTYQRIRIR